MSSVAFTTTPYYQKSTTFCIGLDIQILIKVFDTSPHLADFVSILFSPQFSERLPPEVVGDRQFFRSV